MHETRFFFSSESRSRVRFAVKLVRQIVGSTALFFYVLSTFFI